jgi:hypothetical protein
VTLKPPEESYKEQYKLIRTTGPFAATKTSRPDALLYNQLVRKLGPPRNVQNIAASTGDIVTLKLYPGMPSVGGLHLAAKHGHLNVFQHLHEVYGAINIPEDVIVAAIEEGHLYVLTWIADCYVLTNGQYSLYSQSSDDPGVVELKK